MGVLSVARALTLALALSTSVAAHPKPLGRCGPKHVNLRDPPDLVVERKSSWVPPPTQWIFQPWYQVLTSNAQSQQLRNFQWDPSPVDKSNPEGPINDLSSFQLIGKDKVYASYGVATPNDTYPAYLNYRGTGLLENATSDYSWLGWGCDLNGNDYYVSYSSAADASQTPAGIDVMSVVDTSLDPKTAGAVLAQLKKSKVSEVRQIASHIIKNIQDGARRGLPRITTCDDDCKTNKDLLEVIGGSS